MALIEMDFAMGVGEHYEETLLWENTNPSSSSGFAAQTVTLNDNISNYKYIKIKFANSYSVLDKTIEFLIDTSEIINCRYVNGENTLGTIARGSTAYVRGFQYVSDTSLSFLTGLGIGSTSTSTTVVIPLQIIGLKRSVEVVVN